MNKRIQILLGLLLGAVAITTIYYGIFGGESEVASTTPVSGEGGFFWSLRFLFALVPIVSILSRRNEKVGMKWQFVIYGALSIFFWFLGTALEARKMQEPNIWLWLMFFSIVLIPTLDFILTRKITKDIWMTAFWWGVFALIFWAGGVQILGGGALGTIRQLVTNECTADSITQKSTCWIDEHGVLYADRPEWSKCAENPDAPAEKPVCIVGSGENPRDTIRRANATSITVANELAANQKEIKAAVTQSGVGGEITLHKGQAPLILQVKRGLWSPMVVFADASDAFGAESPTATAWEMRVVMDTGAQSVFTVPVGRDLSWSKTGGEYQFYLVDAGTDKNRQDLEKLGGFTITALQFRQNEGDMRVVKLTLR